MIKIVDKKCNKCNQVVTDVSSDEKVCPYCGGELVRIYGFRKYNEYPAGYYTNFGDKPVYISDREHFWKEAKKRGLDVATSEYRFTGKRRVKRKQFDWENEAKKWDF